MTCGRSTLNSRNINWSIKKRYITCLLFVLIYIFDVHFLNVCHVQTTPKTFYV